MISLITDQFFNDLIFFLKIFFIGLSLIIIVFIIFLLIRTSWLRWRLWQDIIEIVTYKPFGTNKIIKQWMKIKERLESGLESEYKLAVIEADSMLDDILKNLGYSGETLGERLKQVSVDILPNIEQVSEAHKIRNNIVHDPDYRLNLDKAKRAISFYETALTDLAII